MNRLFFKFAALAICTLILSTSGCQKQKSQSREKEIENVQIPEGSAEQVGIDKIALSEMENAILSGEYPNIHSVLISKDGLLIYEKYFQGYDELWGDSLGLVQNSKYRLHDIRSISKSIVGACVGIAIAQGHIQGVEQSIFDFFPEYNQYNIGLRSQLKIKHLLAMTSGLEWNEDVPYSNPENSEILMTASPDPIEYVLSRPMESEPGKYWEYNGGTTQLLAAIVNKTTGMKIDQFANSYLFKPLGIKKYRWTYFPDLDLPAAASGLRLTSRDLLRFGMLYAQNGVWNGKEILTSKWVEDSIQAYVYFGRNNNVGYGYQFWIFDGITIAPGHDHPIIAAVGNGDQRIYMDMENDLIVIVTAGNYNNWTIKKDSEALLTNFVYPALE